MQLRSDKKRSREVSLFEPIGTDREGNEISLCDIMEANGRDALEVLIMKQNLKKLEPAFHTCLKERERRVLCMRYGLCEGREYTQREIAKQMQVSRSYISRIEKAALLKLREELER
ncbi:MAG: sigma factor-like helix-turn-helix DNA-binding protein [Lachnospiraceae bacterium]|nr:sigma factor-like helix-turn-helix DNA-binding protein [Lachnospiraceae bacterium]